MKYKIRTFTISFSKNKAVKFKDRVKQLEIKVQEFETLLQDSPTNKTLEEYKNLKQELENCYKQITEGIIFRSRVKWYEQGEHSSKYFVNLIKKNKAKTYVRNLKIQNDTVTKPVIILKELRKYFETKYERKVSITKIAIIF